MAYINQEQKAKIAAALKLVVPAGWKYSLAIDHHSSIVMTIRSAPVDLIGLIENKCESWHNRQHVQLNPYALERTYSGVIRVVMEDILAALNTDNYDRSDSQSDYFDVGHYVDLNIGRWNKPFVVK